MQTYDVHKTTPEVRQGSRRMMNFRVLIISLVGIVAAFGIIYAVSTAMQPGGDRSVTEPGPKQSAPAVPGNDTTTAPTPAT